MNVKLPMPYFIGGTLFTEAEIIRPNSGVIADTQKMIKESDKFSATLVFLSGCVKALISQESEITEKQQIKSAIRKIPYVVAETLAIKALLLSNNNEDGLEGIYPCPRCGHRVIAQLLKEDDEIIADSRDFISQLHINEIDEYVPIEFHFSEPVELINQKTDEVLIDLQTQKPVSMSSIKIDHPTLGHCISAYIKQGGADEIRLQYRIYIEALKEVDGVPVDKTWKDKYGPLLFDRIKDIDDIARLSRMVHEYGIERRVNKTCPNCGKQWRALVNTTNFFDSGLRQE